MQLILWIVFGGIVGWIASMLMGTDGQQGIFLNIIVGIVGAGVGGYIMNFFGKKGVDSFNFYSFVVALIGAVVLLALLKFVQSI